MLLLLRSVYYILHIYIFIITNEISSNHLYVALTSAISLIGSKSPSRMAFNVAYVLYLYMQLDLYI